MEDNEMRKRFSIFVVCVLAFACSHTTNPVAPSTTGTSVVGSSPVTTGAAISGTVVSNLTTSTYQAEAAAMTVTVGGTQISATVDGQGQFTLTGVPAGTVRLVFTGTGVNATLTLEGVGERDQIRITVRVNGTTAELQDDRHDKPDNGIELEGTLGEVSLAARTLRVNGMLVSVPAGTPIRHGDTTIDFSALRVGDRVHVKGTTTASGVTASEVKVQNASSGPGDGNDQGDDDDHGDDDHGEAELKGALSALSGTCPSISFTVSKSPVTTSGSTQFKDGACSALKNGDKVEVKGIRQANNVVMASRVEKKK